MARPLLWKPRLRALLAGLIALTAATILPGPVGTARAEIRGGAFEVGGTVGVADWQRKVGLNPCFWYGGFAGHRFDVLADRLYLGFRANWEGCVAHQATAARPRIDMILLDATFQYGVRTFDWLFVYSVVGGGMMLGDATPSGGRLTPRTAFVGGVGASATLGHYFLVDLSFRLIVFENFQFGSYGGLSGTTANPVFALGIGGQI